MLPIESALVILVPEAERLVGSFRQRYDPSAAVGVPAHITLLYPFKPPNEIGETILHNLRLCFARVPAFSFALASVRRFGVTTLYLAPEPDEPFRRLTFAIWESYPETPPYGGRHPDVVPHLSIADQITDERQFESVASDFARASRAVLPIRATAADVALMDTTAGRWEIRSTFMLGPRCSTSGLVDD
jgi:hypothetical protein